LASQSYSTNFPVAQNPISQSGQFVTSTSPGVNWSGLELGGGGNLPVAPVDITAPGLAESVDYANPNYGDALAVLTGNWGANQSVSITVGNIPATSLGYEEFEIHLRTDPTTGTGYEITWGYNHNYLLITTWNGGGVVGSGAYTVLYDVATKHAIKPGDTLTASIQGDVITMYTNGVQVAQITDSTFSSGNPGFGFNQGGTSEYGISSFSATAASDDAVNLTAPASIKVTPGVNNSISGVQVVDDASGGETFNVMVADAAGNLSATGSNVTGSGTHTLQINGTLSAVNATLATLGYTSTSSTGDTISVAVTDSDGSTIGQNIRVTSVGHTKTGHTPSVAEANQTVAEANQIGATLPGGTSAGGGGPDNFVFRPNFGANTITDFNVNNSAIQFDKPLFATVSDILAHTVDTVHGAVISDGHGDTVANAGVTLAQLQAHQSDFHLV
jgi:hypothetical protein